MLSLERVRELLGQPDLSDREAAEIRGHLRALAELVFDIWRQERTVPTAGNTEQPTERS